MIEDALPESDRRRRSESLERTMFALRDAREVHDVLAIVTRGLARDFRRPCTAYEFRDGSLKPVFPSEAASEKIVTLTEELELEALRLRVVIRHKGDDLLGVAGDGQLRAIFVLEKAVTPLSEEDSKHLRAIGAHVSLALSNALAFDQLRRYAAEGAALTEAARTILGFNALEPLAAALCKLAIRLAHAERACIYAHRGGDLHRIAFATTQEELGPPAIVELGEVDMSRALAAAFGSAPLIVTRLRLPDEGSTLEHNGLFVVSRSHAFERSELRMVETLKSLAALAIRNVDLYEQSTKANQALAESNSFKDDLMAMFAHDFKGPLTVISGYSELLLDIENDEVKKTANTISEQTRRLARLSEDALALAATQSAGFSLKRLPDDIVAFIREAAAPLDRDGERIFIDAPEEPVIVSFDRQRMRHVVDNVLGNALKYSTGPVEVSIGAVDGEVAIRVADHGIGVPEADLEKIFSRYGRAANARSRGFSGSGVGLYIAKKIIEVHAGRIEVATVENEGSTFSVVLPL